MSKSEPHPPADGVTQPLRRPLDIKYIDMSVFVGVKMAHTIKKRFGIEYRRPFKQPSSWMSAVRLKYRGGHRAMAPTQLQTPCLGVRLEIAL